MNKMSRKVCFEAGYKQCKHDVLGLIDKFYKKKMKDKQLSEEEWYSAETISGLDLEELKARING